MDNYSIMGMKVKGWGRVAQFTQRAKNHISLASISLAKIVCQDGKATCQMVLKVTLTKYAHFVI
jgi:hypothetical protein